MGEYNRDQWLGLTSIRDALEQMPEAELEALRASLSPYLEFRRDLAVFHTRCFQNYCHKACFETELSACCGFESIITFFADQLITCLLVKKAELDLLVQVLERPAPGFFGPPLDVPADPRVRLGRCTPIGAGSPS